MKIALWKRWVEFFEEESPEEPRYDPIHLATVLIVVQVVVGALFWLLWILLVYEGGLGSFWNASSGEPQKEGWVGNVSALVTLVLIIEALRRADRRHARPR